MFYKKIIHTKVVRLDNESVLHIPHASLWRDLTTCSRLIYGRSVGLRVDVSEVTTDNPNFRVDDEEGCESAGPRINLREALDIGCRVSRGTECIP